MRKKLAALLALCLTLSLTTLPAWAELSLEDGRELLQTYYVQEISEDILNRDTLDEILDGLGDPYTFHMTGEEYKRFQDRVNGETLVGVGLALSVEVSKTDEGVLITTVLPKSPAEQAGLVAGDRIMAVNGQTVQQGDDLSKVLRGEAGTEVVLDVLKKTDQTRQTLTLVRQEVHVPTASYELIRDAGWMELLSFGLDTTDIMEEAMNSMQEQAALWVVDLRENLGGLSQAGANASALFTDSRPMFYFRNRQGNVFLVTAKPDLLRSQDKPLMILTSPQTASAAECFTATARDYRLGITLGQRSYGKGIAQTVFDRDTHPDMFEDDCLKVTTYQLYSPDGTTTHKLGVIPTLLLSPKHTQAVAELLSTAKPKSSIDHMRLDLAGYHFYINMPMAQSKAYQSAMAELMEALPPSAQLSVGMGGEEWVHVTASSMADKMGLDVDFRTFSDVESSKYRREIDTLAVYDLIGGAGNSTFQPEKLLTRAEVCAMLTNALALPIPKDGPAFTDVPHNAWYADAVSAAVSAGLMAGCGDGTFRPDDTITYEELVTMVSGAAVYGNLLIARLNERDPYIDELGDCLNYPKWAQRSARNLNLMHVMLKGAEPTQQVTREMAAALMCRTMERIKLIWPDGQ